MKRSPVICLAFLALALSSAPAQAQTIGYSLDLFLPPGIDTVSAADAPAWKLTNISSPGFEIVELKVGIGNPAFNFDSGQNETHSPGVGFVLHAPDSSGDGATVRSDEFRYTFTGLGAGKEFAFRTDMDPDSVDAQVDFRTIFFNNGAAPNSTIFVRFSDNRVLSMQMPDDTVREAYNFTQTEGSAVPEPSSVLLFLPALMGLAAFRNRRSRGTR